MSIRLRELIRQIRACKTAAEERAVIAKEGALCRKAFKEKNDKFRHRNVAKLLYIHMLGYPTHFGQMESLKLIASHKFSEKRIGYLALMILLDERQDVLMLVTNILHSDLTNSKNPYVIGLALCALANVCSADMARNLQSEVRRFFKNTNPYLRKKAISCAIRCIRKAPELIEDFLPSALSLLDDRNHAVLLCVIQLLIEMIEINEEAVIDQIRKTVPTLVRWLKNLVLAGYVSEYDVMGITDPFIQTKIIHLLRLLGTNDPESSDLMNDILAQVAINTEPTKNPGNTILYECVMAIMAIDAEGGLRVLAINILGRFLLNRNNNFRYVALNTLCKVVDKDIQAIQRHRNTIVDCLKHSDISIRRRALDLIYALVTKNNVKALVKELLNYLALTSRDIEFKTNLAHKICQIAQKYSPNKKWHIETIISVLSIAGNFTRESVVSEIIALISRNKSLYAFAVHKLFRALKKNMKKPQLLLINVGIWCIGEYGDILVSNIGAEQAQTSDPGNKYTKISETKVLNLLHQILKHISSTNTTKEYTLNALIKLTVRFGDGYHKRICKMLAAYKTSMSLELQQRSCEYTELISSDMDKIRLGVISRMPIIGKEKSKEKKNEENTSEESDNEGDENEGDDSSNEEIQEDEEEEENEKDIVCKTEKKLKSKTKATSVPEPEMNILDLCLLDEPNISTGNVTDQNSNTFDLLDGLMDMGNVQPSQSTQKPQIKQSQNNTETYPPKVIFESKGLSITFFCSIKLANPEVLLIDGTFTNASSSEMANWEFQVAVPKYMKIKMEPASTNAIPANGGEVKQRMILKNQMHGTKKIRLRIRLSYVTNGKVITEQTQIDSLP